MDYIPKKLHDLVNQKKPGNYVWTIELGVGQGGRDADEREGWIMKSLLTWR